MSGLSLAEQIALLEAAPVDFDPEDGDVFGNGSSAAVAAREHYLDVAPSTLRDSIEDPKYEGVPTTRKSLMEESEDEEEDEQEDEEEDEQEDEEEDEQEDEEEDEDDEDDDDDDDDNDDDDEEEEEEKNTEERVEPKSAPKKPSNQGEEKDISMELKHKREEDKRKGMAVSRQMAIWDALLEARIRMQKAVNAANRLPRPSDMGAYIRQPECQEALNKMLDEALLVTDELYDLQEYLLMKNEGLSLPPRKRRRLDDGEKGKQLEDVSTDVIAIEHAMHPWLIQTLHKWSSKIQAVAPSVLLPSNRNAFSKGSQQVKSAVQLAEETLRGHDKLLARTQIRRGKEKRIGMAAEEDSTADGVKEDPELFDDTDFYQQLLRDVIDSRRNGGDSDDWMAMQKVKKAKKKVDTKASKGRKIRYHVHEKIQNFMVPVPVIGAWHEEKIDELFALLGKGYEAEVDDDVLVMPQGNDNATVELESQLDGPHMSGFKVFG